MAAPQYPPAPAVPTRPLGVAILSVLVGIFGVLLILGGLLILVGATALAVLGVLPGFAGLPLAVVGALVLIVGIIILAAALGLWHLRLWALVLALIFSFLEIVQYALAGQFASLGFVLALVIFVYLLAVHRHFH